MNKIFFLFLSCISFNLLAGSGVARLECESESGRTKIESNIPDLANKAETLMVTIDDSSFEYHLNEENVTKPDVLANVIHVNDEVVAHNIYSVVAQKVGATGNEYISTLTALPETVEHTETNTKTTYKFESIYKGLDPRSMSEFWSTESETNKIHVDCTVVYEI